MNPASLESTPERLLDRVASRVADTPDRLALRFFAAGEIRDQWTFAELWSRSQNVCQALHRHNVLPAQRAALVFDPGLDFVAAFLGCHLAGVTPVPTCYPRQGRRLPRFDSVVSDAQPTALLSTAAVIDAMLGGQYAGLDQQLTPLAVDQLVSRESAPSGASIRSETVLDPSHLHRPQDDADSLALLQYTSGSTDRPKGVRVTQANLSANLATITHAFRLRSDGSETCVSWLPLFHDMGLIGGILSSLWIGATTILFSPQDFLRRPLWWLQLISQYRASVSGAPNFAYQLAFDRIAPEDAAKLDLSSWRTAFCGAEPISERTLGDFSRRFSANGFDADRFYPCYGLAEATLLVTGGDGPGPLHVVDVDRQALEAGDVQIRPRGDRDETRRLVGCGFPQGVDADRTTPAAMSRGRNTAATEIQIVDPETLRIVTHRVGEIWVRGPSVADGYWTPPKHSQDPNSPQDNLASTPQHDADGSCFGQTLRSPDAGASTGGWLRTGDLGFQHDGQLFIVGRVKDLIIIRGRNLHPSDLEQTIQTRLGESIKRSAVFSVDGARGEALAVIAEVDRQMDRQAHANTARELRRVVIEEHEVDPQSIVLVREATLPMTTSGKIRRGHCREQLDRGELKILYRYDAAMLASQVPISFPRLDVGNGETTTHLIGDWMKHWMIARGGVSPQDIRGNRPLTEYGLDSMMAVEMSGEIENWADVELSPLAAWDHPTIDDLAAHVAELTRATRL
ncbi:MAG: AMP-binding protein [Planctomycetota bacterium]